MNSPKQTHQNYRNNVDEEVVSDNLPRFSLPQENVDNKEDFPRLSMTISEEKTEPFIELKSESEEPHYNAEPKETKENTEEAIKRIKLMK